MDEAVTALLEDLNTRPFKRLPGTRASQYAALDRPVLTLLPATRYELARYHVAKVAIDYHVAVEQHLYSVPHALVGQRVEIRATARAIEVLHAGKRVAAHARSYVRHGYTTDPLSPAPMAAARR